MIILLGLLRVALNFKVKLFKLMTSSQNSDKTFLKIKKFVNLKFLKRMDVLVT